MAKPKSVKPEPISDEEYLNFGEAEPAEESEAEVASFEDEELGGQEDPDLDEDLTGSEPEVFLPPQEELEQPAPPPAKSLLSPRPPSVPIPEGVEDCYGKYQDPDVDECQRCLEAPNCRQVMLQAAGAAPAKVKAPPKPAVAKPVKAKPGPKPAQSKPPSAAKKPTAPAKAPSAKLEPSFDPALKSVLGASGLQAGGELKYIGVNAYRVSIKDVQRVVLTRTNTANFGVLLLNCPDLVAVGLNSTLWQQEGQRYRYVGKPAQLAAQLKAYLKHC